MKSFHRKSLEFLESSNEDFDLNSLEHHSDRHNLELIHHPVHITGDTGKISTSAFIPFCSFGGMGALGEESSRFSLPVCKGFRRRILDGKLCYVMDVNRFKDKLKVETLQEVGLSMLVDVNDEFDLREISARNIEIVKTFEDFTEEFVRVEESDKIMTSIETISKYDNMTLILSNMTTTFPRSSPCKIIWRRKLCHHRC